MKANTSTTQELLDLIPKHKIGELSTFVKEMNRREYLVRFKKSHTFDEFTHIDNHDYFGFGFNVEGKSVPYFHPNRSFHDEIIWLNKKVFYNNDCSFEDMLINAAIVKFYGPSNTIEIATRDTGKGFIQYSELVNNSDYLLKCMLNLEEAKKKGEKIYGTTELRTSLQTEARNYTRAQQTVYDNYLGVKNDENRVARTSDMLYWFKKLGPMFVEFYSKKPTMEESFNFLNSINGIGNYYGYHFSTNLARMPKIGTEHLLLQKTEAGNINEDDDFVAPGVGAMNTINWLFEDLGVKMNTKTAAKIIVYIRDNQHDFFQMSNDDKLILKSVTEFGAFTTFGCEISCCQFSVFKRLKDNKKLAEKRALAPISKESIGIDCAVDIKEKINKQLKLF